ncbi:MAG TPA: DUF2085 domain-containing protein [Verrucomicrobiota bacterium]|mgnify:CR=1 FL=1|nr:DUF2085 domain-containing protein [Verrucomicrobiota bacterium]
METLFNVFGHVCGQQIEHTWLIGGVPLPVCQRCTGLFVGAALAVILVAWFRPRLDGWFLPVHAVFLLGVAPFRLGWIEDGPELRTLTGCLYGAGVAVLLMRWPVEVLGRMARFRCLRRASVGEGEVTGSAGCRWPRCDAAGAWGYWIGLSAGAAVLSLLCLSVGSLALWGLALGIAAGGLGFVLLLVLNVLALVWLAVRRCGIGPAPA